MLTQSLNAHSILDAQNQLNYLKYLIRAHLLTQFLTLLNNAHWILINISVLIYLIMFDFKLYKYVHVNQLVQETVETGDIKMKFQPLVLIFLLMYNAFYFASCKQPIFIGGLYYLHPFLNSSTALTELAVSEINARNDILPDYEIIIVWKETNCDQIVAFESFLQYQIVYPTYGYHIPIVFGLPCIGSIDIVAEIVAKYNVLLVTFSTFLPFSTSSYFPNFVLKAFPTGRTASLAQIKFIQDNGWNRVAIVSTEEENSLGLSYRLNQAMHELEIENTLEILSFENEEDQSNEQNDVLIDNLQSGGYRVIIFNTPLSIVNNFFCRVSNRSLNFQKYTFLLQSFSPYTWSDSSACPLDKLQELVNGSIGFNQHPRVEDIISMGRETFSGIPSLNLTSNYGLDDSPPFDFEYWDVVGLYMYDAMWALGLALNKTLSESLNASVISPIEIRQLLPKYVYQNIIEQPFKSVTGDVDFENGFRVSHRAQLIEYSYYETFFRGLYVNLPPDFEQIENLTAAELINKSDFLYWDSTSSDGVENKYSPLSLFGIVAVLALLAAVYIVVLIIIIIVAVYKRYPPAIYSEPAMNIFLLIATLFLLAFAILLTFDGKFATFESNAPECSVYCHVLIWLACVACSLILGGVLAKALKLYAIWVLNRFEKTSRQLLRFRFLVLVPITLALIDTAVIAFWAGFDPVPYQSDIVRSEVENPPFYRIAFCEFSVNAPLIILLLIKIGLIIISIFLAYHLRNITHKSQRYTFAISFIMYTTLFFSIFIFVVLGFVSNFDTKIGLTSLMSIFAACITASIIGIPVLYYLYKDPSGKTLFNTSNMKEFPEDSTLLRKRIESLERDLEHYTSTADKQQLIVNSVEDGEM